MLTIIRGKQFFLCDERGDVTSGALGLFAHDTRYLSSWVLRLDGQLPEALGESHGQHLERSFVQRCVASERLAADAVLVRRTIVLADDAMYERLELRNVGMEPVRFPLELEARADFDDIFTVKDTAFAKTGDLIGNVGLPDGADPHDERAPTSDGAGVVLRGAGTECHIDATRAFRLDGASLRWDVSIDPHETWICDLRVAWSTADTGDRLTPTRFDEEAAQAQAALEAWRAGMPRLSGGEHGIRRTWRTSIDDLGALRIAAGDTDGEDLLTAAGAPWFMTVFGRDSLITCMQTMLLGPHRAKAVLEYLARRQSQGDDPERDAEPGKILHEVREGAIAGRGYDLYYGSIDSTPLFLMLLGELHAWTGDDEFVRTMWPHALRALEWVERFGDPDGDGYLEYERRSAQGLENQSWKDSWDSQRHVDGTLATGSIAPAEVQAYAYAARVAMGRLAREVMGDAPLADRLDGDAAALRTRFQRDFWVAADALRPVPTGRATGADATVAADGCFALALDGAKHPVATVTSNIGHLAWCGIVDGEQARSVARQLTSDRLFSGWGVRTMADHEQAYNPISYHCGTVWPHDTVIAIAGLARAGFAGEAAQLGRGLLDAADHFDGRLPEVFAGLDRTATPWPVRYPTASSPQAWAAGAPVALLSALLGIRPDTAGRRLVSDVSDAPDWLEGLEIVGVNAFDREWRIAVEQGHVHVGAD